MGFYINPKDMSKERWLGLWGSPAKPTDKLAGHHLVCLVDNGLFTAAAIAYNDAERDAFNSPSDQRPKRWFLVPDECLENIEPDLKGKLS